MNVAFKKGKVDQKYLIAFFILLGFGLVMQYSASSSLGEARFDDPSFYVRGQFVRIVLGMVVGLICTFINYQILKKGAFWIALAGIISLIATLVYHKLHPGQATARWFPIGGFNFQPSEFAKLALIIYLSSFIERHERHLDDFKRGFIPPVIIMLIMVILIIVEPNYSTAAVFTVFGLIVLFIGGTKLLHFLPFIGGFALLSVVTILRSPYKLMRILTFLEPEKDLQGAGYQIHQSMITLGNGGFFGRGLGGSIEKNLFLPDMHTDFIFSVVGEELGFIGAVVLLSLYLYLFIRGIKIALRAPDVFGNLLGIGLSSCLFIYVIVNVGVTCGLLPVTGLPLPFISYGGSSMLFNFACVGIILNISRYAVPQAKTNSLVMFND
ncbi:MAG TPA: putative lipid II flippase FtsW [Candidatus Marinimicrobia bacterium]|jgi:cell division protein FtsW|nr:putative lipid II flippase FtsW [Candidatus Neomarinimicrobiota bacterium]HOO14178.1 putative lipid II flippase FtsW [Candidatus Neomarinimicrobiota bacterium]HPX99932.1 putative lipid II flippase FtsW [Candidatus Neomarinimicrobiota bacterium]HQC62025.1 putative lipid II flippase FtsW [Candidatus Neomarinimicrobiota bacterium]